MSLGLFREQLRQTDWRHFFKKNGFGDITWAKVRWTEQPNDISCAIVVHGEISGGYRGYGGKGLFATWANDSGLAETREQVEKDTVMAFESFAYPNCRCRVGFHWKCGVHHNWRG